jgi:hypothetical protein
MNRNNQESLAGRFQSFDTELPKQVRAEFFAPRRPRILGHAEPATLKQSPKWPLYLAAFVAVLIFGAAVWRQQNGAERAKISQAISLPTATPQPTIVPSPTPGPAPRAMLAKGRVVPRAQLVTHTVPRAKLVSLPSDWPPLFVGGRYLATMPYDNLEVLATYKGWLASQDDLPSHPNQIGDMYLVNGVPFVWLFAPGASRAGWIDP